MRGEANGRFAECEDMEVVKPDFDSCERARLWFLFIVLILSGGNKSLGMSLRECDGAIYPVGAHNVKGLSYIR